jgi:prepilin-type processing-associated H-X9-DG protein
MRKLSLSQSEKVNAPLALGRKNYLFADSHDAAKNIAMFYSFFSTCLVGYPLLNIQNFADV